MNRLFYEKMKWLVRLDTTMLAARIAIWALVMPGVLSVISDLRNYGGLIQPDATGGLLDAALTSFFIFMLYSMIWDHSRAPWRKPVIVALVGCQVIENALVQLSWWNSYDIARQMMDVMWLLALLSLYSFRPLFREVD